MVLGVVLVVLGLVLRQCSEQMFGTDSVRNNVPSQHSSSQGKIDITGAPFRLFETKLSAPESSLRALASGMLFGRFKPEFRAVLRVQSLEK